MMMLSGGLLQRNVEPVAVFGKAATASAVERIAVIAHRVASSFGTLETVAVSIGPGRRITAAGVVSVIGPPVCGSAGASLTQGRTRGLRIIVPSGRDARGHHDPTRSVGG